MASAVKPWSSIMQLPRAALDIAHAIERSGLWFGLSSRFEGPVAVGDDFVGINIATADDPAVDDFVVAKLRELGIRHVRMDFTYGAFAGRSQRLLERVLAEGLDVLLDLFPPREDAAAMTGDTAAGERWRAFVRRAFDEYAGRVAAFEIGNTPNRGRWSGFRSVGYVRAWAIAADEAKDRGVTLAGPNVSDFEPLYNIGYLAAMRRAGATPDIHTDNLFVERVVEPEAFDHRVLGRWLAPLLKLNLVKKARIIERIGRDAGCTRTFCTFNCWTLPRLARRSGKPMQTQVDYMVRYLVLAAASGALERVYWGPLICHRDGLIDCGSTRYPAVEKVSRYDVVSDDIARYVVQPGFHAMRQMVGAMRGARCVQGASADNGLSHYVFERPGGAVLHVTWSRDAGAVPLSAVYPAGALDGVTLTDAAGNTLGHMPASIGERPLLLTWPAGTNAYQPSTRALAGIERATATVLPTLDGHDCLPVSERRWRGAMAVRHGEGADAALARLRPEALLSAPAARVLRDKRNRLWNIAAPGGETLTVKLNRVGRIRALTYRFRQSKGRRHWNNASAMLRRGVSTPRPVAFFEHPEASGVHDSYYVCEFVAGAFSAREVMASLRAGQQSFRGMDTGALIDGMAGFVCRLHNRGVHHRDLSAGNLLMRGSAEDALEYFLIDVGRARARSRGHATPRERVADIMRFVYKLGWPDRERFVAAYDAQRGATLPGWWRLAVRYYEHKLGLKKSLRRRRASRAARTVPNAPVNSD